MAESTNIPDPASVAEEMDAIFASEIKPSWQDRWNHSLLGNYGTPQCELVQGRGSWVTDSEGNEYLDLLSGIAVNALGHAHPAIIEAVHTQLSTLGHTSNIHAHPQVITLAENLLGILQEVSPQTAGHNPAADAQVFFCNSGAEANEAAFKIARATGRPKILAAERGFHGRTMGSLALTGQPDKRRPFEPMPAGVEFFPYGDLDAVRALADTDTAAIIVESIQGETGVIPAPAGFLRGLREICDAHGILLIIDEVQAGMGRTGHWFGFQAVEPDPFLPDVITMAKGLGGGLPIGACIATKRAQLLSKGMHGTTFGGNPVVCAAANAVIRTIRDRHLLSHVQTMGQKFASALEQLPQVDHIRGHGLMLGVVLHEPLTKNPLEYGLILNQPSPEVLRIVPPLNITATEVEIGVDKLRKLLVAE